MMSTIAAMVPHSSCVNGLKIFAASSRKLAFASRVGRVTQRWSESTRTGVVKPTRFKRSTVIQKSLIAKSATPRATSFTAAVQALSVVRRDPPLTNVNFTPPFRASIDVNPFARASTPSNVRKNSVHMPFHGSLSFS